MRLVHDFLHSAFCRLTPKVKLHLIWTTNEHTAAYGVQRKSISLPYTHTRVTSHCSGERALDAGAVQPCCNLVENTLTTKHPTNELNEWNSFFFNPLTPNDPYSGRTAPPTSKCRILYIYSTNIGIAYFKHGILSPFFFLQNAVCFLIITYLFPVLFTFYIQGVLKFEK